MSEESAPSPTEEEQVQQELEKNLKQQAEKKASEAKVVTRAEFDAEMAKLREENEDLKDLLMRAKAQGRAEIRQKSEDKHKELKEIYEGTVIELE